jgi:hypothetical protein
MLELYEEKKNILKMFSQIFCLELGHRIMFTLPCTFIFLDLFNFTMCNLKI